VLSSVATVMCTVKSFNVERHYKIHSEEYDCYKGKSRKKKLESLKSALVKQTNMFKLGNGSEEVTMASIIQY